MIEVKEFERWNLKRRKNKRKSAEGEKKTKVLWTKALLYHWNDLWVESLQSSPQCRVIKTIDGFGSRGQSQTGLAVKPRELPVTGDVKINLPWKSKQSEMTNMQVLSITPFSPTSLFCGITALKNDSSRVLRWSWTLHTLRSFFCWEQSNWPLQPLAKIQGLCFNRDVVGIHKCTHELQSARLTDEVDAETIEERGDNREMERSEQILGVLFGCPRGPQRRAPLAERSEPRGVGTLEAGTGLFSSGLSAVFMTLIQCWATSAGKLFACE